MKAWLYKLLGLHVHSYGIWHHDSHGELVRTCYECGKVVKVKMRLVV